MAVQRWPQNDNAPLTHSLTATSRLADGLRGDDDEQCCEEKKHQNVNSVGKNIIAKAYKTKAGFFASNPNAKRTVKGYYWIYYKY